MARKLSFGVKFIGSCYLITFALALLFAWSTSEAADARVCWTAPTENTDGSLLTDLAGFFVYWSNTPGGPYSDSVRISDPSRRCKTLDLDPGTYYLVGTAYNEANIQSEFSLEVERVVAPPPTVPKSPTNLRNYGQ